jgi:hypothetical protein
VFDGRLAMVGTYNLDPTSQRLNSEVMAVVWSEPFAEDVARGPRRLIGRGPPAVYEYRIRRDDAGGPVLDENGKPIVQFGPENHCSPAEWKALAAYWGALRTADRLPGLSPIF